MKQKKHLLSSLVLFLSLFFCLGFSQVKAATVDVTVDGGTYMYSFAYQVLEQVNEERAAAGLNALTLDTSLLNSAMTRAAELSIYYSHTRPNGTKFSTINTKAYAENAAWGYTSSSNVMAGWMSSTEGHREAILNSSFKSIGIGCFYHNGTYYWIQLFSRSSASSVPSQQANKTGSPKISVLTTNLSLSQSSYSASKPQIVTYQKNPGSSSPLYAKIAPSTFKWSSSNTSVATVDSTGTITAKSIGSTVITRIFASNSNYSLGGFTVEIGYDLSKATVEAIPDQYYTGSDIEPTPKVTYEGRTLTGDDYEISYANNIYTGSAAQIILTGKGLYSGTKTVYFSIYVPKFQTVTPDSYDVLYMGQTDDLMHFTVIDNLGKTLTEGVHYTVSYKIYERQKTIVATVEGISPYLTSKNVSLNMTRADISQAKVTVPSTVTLTGTSAAPVPVVTYNGKTLVEGTDYTVGYSNNCTVGTGYVHIYGKGYYKSWKRVAFTIVASDSDSESDSQPDSGSQSHVVTGINIPTLKAKAYYNKVKLSWQKISGASGYEIYRKTGNGSYKKIKTISSGSTVSYTDKKISLNKKYTYYIRAYKPSASSISKAVTVTAKLSRPTLTVKAKNNKHVLTWSKVSGANGYIIYRKTNSGSYKKVKTISAKASRKCTLRTSDGNLYSYKIRPYRTVKGKKVVSNVSRTKKAYGK